MLLKKKKTSTSFWLLPCFHVVIFSTIVNLFNFDPFFAGLFFGVFLTKVSVPSSPSSLRPHTEDNPIIEWRTSHANKKNLHSCSPPAWPTRLAAFHPQKLIRTRHHAQPWTAPVQLCCIPTVSLNIQKASNFFSTPHEQILLVSIPFPLFFHSFVQFNNAPTILPSSHPCGYIVTLHP